MNKPKIVLLAEWFFDQFIYPFFAGWRSRGQPRDDGNDRPASLTA